MKKLIMLSFKHTSKYSVLLLIFLDYNLFPGTRMGTTGSPEESMMLSMSGTFLLYNWTSNTLVQCCEKRA